MTNHGMPADEWLPLQALETHGSVAPKGEVGGDALRLEFGDVGQHLNLSLALFELAQHHLNRYAHIPDDRLAAIHIRPGRVSR